MYIIDPHIHANVKCLNKFRFLLYLIICPRHWDIRKCFRVEHWPFVYVCVGLVHNIVSQYDEGDHDWRYLTDYPILLSGDVSPSLSKFSISLFPDKSYIYSWIQICVHPCELQGYHEASSNASLNLFSMIFFLSNNSIFLFW